VVLKLPFKHIMLWLSIIRKSEVNCRTALFDLEVPLKKGPCKR
jgi:hypothetical protein